VAVLCLGIGGALVSWLGRPQPLPAEKIVKVERGAIARSVVAEKVASPQALDEAQKNHEVSLNRKQFLEAAARSAEAQVAQARAGVAAAQAAHDLAQESRRHATIGSPIRGVVLSRDTEVGDAVSSILNLGSAATVSMRGTRGRCGFGTRWKRRGWWAGCMSRCRSSWRLWR
jgi:multidrug resistance efflux pump